LHLPSDRSEKEWLCVDFAAVERTLDAAIRAKSEKTSRAASKTSPSRGLGFCAQPRSGGRYRGWGGSRGRSGEEVCGEKEEDRMKAGRPEHGREEEEFN